VRSKSNTVRHPAPATLSAPNGELAHAARNAPAGWPTSPAAAVALVALVLAAACSFDAGRLQALQLADSSTRAADARDTAGAEVDASLDHPSDDDPSDRYLGVKDSFVDVGTDGAGAMAEVIDAAEAGGTVVRGGDASIDQLSETGSAFDAAGARDADGSGTDGSGTDAAPASDDTTATGGAGGSLDTAGAGGAIGGDTGGVPGFGGTTATGGAGGSFDTGGAGGADAGGGTGGMPGLGGTTATGGSGGSVSLPAGLVAWWKMDEPAGSSMATDASGNGNNAILTGLNTASAWTTGRTGGALKCDGSGGALVGDSVSLDGIATGVTISAWVNRLGASTGFTAILSREIGTTITEYYYLGLSGDKAEFYSSSGGLSTTTIPIGIWTHMAATDDGNTVRLYVNGFQVASKNVNDVFKADTSKLTICGNQNDSSGAVTQRWNGLVDDLQLYNRALTATEIASLAK